MLYETKEHTTAFGFRFGINTIVPARTLRDHMADFRLFVSAARCNSDLKTIPQY